MRSALSVILLVLAFSPPGPGGERTRVPIDADTANEVDDPYAIVRALIAPELEVVGLAAAQWQVSHWTTPTAAEELVATPPEATPRKVWMYESIDAAAMKEDFFAAVDDYFQ